jgi:hypothetical protein
MSWTTKNFDQKKPEKNKYELRSHSEFKTGGNTTNIFVGSRTPVVHYVGVSVDSVLTFSGLLNFLVTFRFISK